MALIDDVKLALRINSSTHNTEINDLINSAYADLQLSGIDTTEKAFKLLNPKTMVNVLGTDGKCESLVPFNVVGVNPTLSDTVFLSGNYSIKINPSLTSESYIWKEYGNDKAKRYIAGAWVYVESYSSGALPQISLSDSGGITPVRYSVNANVSYNDWQFIYVKIPTSNTFSGANFRISIGTLSSGISVSYFDEILVYEVDSTVYDAIGTLDALLKRAIITYCKAYFGYDNPDAERFIEAYKLLKTHLALAQDYGVLS